MSNTPVKVTNIRTIEFGEGYDTLTIKETEDGDLVFTCNAQGASYGPHDFDVHKATFRLPKALKTELMEFVEKSR